jgi:hypothetical protein
MKNSHNKIYYPSYNMGEHITLTFSLLQSALILEKQIAGRIYNFGFYIALMHKVLSIKTIFVLFTNNLRFR